MNVEALLASPAGRLAGKRSKPAEVPVDFDYRHAHVQDDFVSEYSRFQGAISQWARNVEAEHYQATQPQLERINQSLHRIGQLDPVYSGLWPHTGVSKYLKSLKHQVRDVPSVSPPLLRLCLQSLLHFHATEMPGCRLDNEEANGLLRKWLQDQIFATSKLDSPSSSFAFNDSSQSARPSHSILSKSQIELLRPWHLKSILFRAPSFLESKPYQLPPLSNLVNSFARALPTTKLTSSVVSCPSLQSSGPVKYQVQMETHRKVYMGRCTSVQGDFKHLHFKQRFQMLEFKLWLTQQFDQPFQCLLPVKARRKLQSHRKQETTFDSASSWEKPVHSKVVVEKDSDGDVSADEGCSDSCQPTSSHKQGPHDENRSICLGIRAGNSDSDDSSIHILQDQTSYRTSLRSKRARSRAEQSCLCTDDIVPVLPQDNLVVNLSHKKKKVDPLDPRFDTRPESPFPLGFWTRGINPKSRRLMDLVAVDATELLPRFQQSRFMQQVLGQSPHNFYPKEYVVIFQGHQATVFPGATVWTWWTSSPKQISLNFHWDFFWRQWFTGSFQKKRYLKLLRYHRMKRLQWYIGAKQTQHLEALVEQTRSVASSDWAKLAIPRVASTLEYHVASQGLSLPLKDITKSLAVSAGPAPASSDDLFDNQGADFARNDMGESGSDKHDEDETRFGLCMEKTLSDSAETPDSLLASLRGLQPDRSKRLAQHMMFKYRKLFYLAKGFHHLYGPVRTKLSKLCDRHLQPIVAGYYREFLSRFRDAYSRGRGVYAKKATAERDWLKFKEVAKDSKQDVAAIADFDHLFQLKEETDESSVAETSTLRQWLPPFNSQAKRPCDVYKFDDVIPPNILESFSVADPQSWLQNDPNLRLCQTVSVLISRCGSKATQQRSESPLAELRTLNWLIAMYPLKGKTFSDAKDFERSLQRRRWGRCNATVADQLPSVSVDWMLQTFMQKNQHSGTFHFDGDTKLLATILFCCVHVNGASDWSFDFHPLVFLDWNDRFTQA